MIDLEIGENQNILEKIILIFMCHKNLSQFDLYLSQTL